MRRHLAILVVASAILAAGCQAAASSSAAELSDADRAAIKHGEDEWVRLTNAKDFTGAARAYWTADASLLPPNGPAVSGHDGIATWLKNFPPFSGFTLEQVTVEGRGDFAYVRGKYTLNVTMPGAAAPTADVGKHITIWKKQPDGSWKAAAGIFNSDLPLLAPAPAKK